MVFLVCQTYCREHFLHVMQYIRFELLQVMLVLQSYVNPVTVHLIFPLVFSIGQYLHIVLHMHLFLIMFGGFVTVVSDLLLLAFMPVLFVISVSDALSWRSLLLLDFFFRKSIMEVCFLGAVIMPPAGNTRF